MSKVQFILSCEHCGLSKQVPYRGQAIQDVDFDKAGFKQIYYMPFTGNHRLFCAACIEKLKKLMGDFVGEKLDAQS